MQRRRGSSRQRDSLLDGRRDADAGQSRSVRHRRTREADLPAQCVGGKCGKGIATGNPCAKSDQCESGNCVEGVCCDTPCAGACKTCLAKYKASGSDGVCGFVLSGADPDDECAESNPPCGPDGTCDGKGQCRPFAPDTKECGAATCAGGTVTGPLCDGKGTCAQNAKPCGAYKCNSQGTGCMPSCSTAADCAVGNFCKNQVCTPTVPDGQPCKKGEECVSGFCADDVCCNKACDGSCQACSALLNAKGKNGECGPVKDGTLDPRGICKKNTSNPCGTDGKCDDQGQCRLAPNKTPCGQASCKSESAVTQVCDGYGKCQESATACTPYRCDTTSNTCKTACAATADCAAGAVCDPVSKQCAFTDKKCKDEYTVEAPGGTLTDCKPYRCAAGACRDACSTSNDCAPGTECTGGKCAASPGGDGGAGAAGSAGGDATHVQQDKGCGCRTGRGGSRLGGFAAIVALAALRTRRSRRPAFGRRERA